MEQKSIRIYEEDYDQIVEWAAEEDRTRIAVLHRLVELGWEHRLAKRRAEAQKTKETTDD